MNNKKKLQIVFFALLVIGCGLTVFKEARPFALLYLLILQPIVALYYISLFKKEEVLENTELRLRAPLLISLQVTFVVLLFKYLFNAMHWPFFGPITVVLFACVISTVLFSIAFVVINRKIIQSIFVFELLIMVMPILSFIGIYSTSGYTKSEYAIMLNKQYTDLREIEHTLYQQVKKDSSIDLTLVDTLQYFRIETENIAGGLDEKAQVIGSLEKINSRMMENQIKKLANDSLSEVIKNKQPVTVIEYLNTLTRVQIDLLVKGKK